MKTLTSRLLHRLVWGRIIDCVLAESQKLEVKIIDWTRGTGAYLDSVTRQLREYNAIGVIIINPPFNTPNDRGQACRPEPHNMKQAGESASPAPTG